MHLLSVDGLGKSYEGRALFSGVDFGVASGDRIAVVGVNGSGKSTLLKIVAGAEVADAGSVVFSRAAKVAYLAQEAPLPGDASVLEVVAGADTDAMGAVRDYQRAAREVAAHPADAGASDALAAASGRLDVTGGWAAEHHARAILDRLGFRDTSVRVGALSGGQRRRVALARTLLSDSNILVLDEPTNQLDAETVEWLEATLRSFRGGLLMVTHDRYFLERLTNRMFEIDRGRVYLHTGAYSGLLEARAARETHDRQAEARRQNVLRKEIAWLRRRPKARTSKPRFRVEQAEALLAAAPPEEHGALQLGTGRRRLGDRAIELEDVSFSYDDHIVLRAVSLELGAGDRIGIVGPNGAGKTTLLRLIGGELAAGSGRVWRSPNVLAAHYAQDTIVPPVATRVIDVITEVAQFVPLEDGRRMTASALAERFLFDGPMQHRSVSVLSGGERRRLALLRVLMDAPNVLLLDEPTNDLDLDTLAVLEDYLDTFKGVLVVASHDRFLLNRLCDHFHAVEPDGAVRKYPGDWDEYRELSAVQSRGRAAPAPVEKTRRPAKPRTKLSYKDEREMAELERRLPVLEERRHVLAAELAEAGSDYEALQRVSAEMDLVSAQLDAAEERWLELQLLAEELAAGGADGGGK